MVPLRLFVDRFGLRVLGGADPADRRVSWVHVSELADPVPFLSGGELLLTAGIDFRPQDSAAYVARLSSAGVIAVGFGLTPVFDEVPASLIAACEEARMTLLEIPPEVPFAALSQAHHAELVRGETLALRRLSDGQGVLIRAAGGPGPLRAVVDRLAELLEGWVLVVDHNRDRTWAAGPVRADRRVSEALNRACASRTPLSAALNAADQQVEIQRLIGPSPSGYAMAVARAAPFTVADRGLIAVAASALSLLFTAPAEIASSDTLGAAAVAGLLRPPSWEAVLAAPFDLPEDTTWRVVRSLPSGLPGPPGAVAHTLAEVLATPYVVPDGDAFTALVPGDRPPADQARALDEAGIFAGISRPHRAEDLAEAREQAEAALNGSRIKGAAVVAEDPAEGLLGLLEPAEAARHTAGLLAPLDAARDAPVLLGTLRAWLAQHGNWDRTAAELGVHRNTVRHRIRQTARLLDLDLADPDVRMELWFALRWRARGG
ncbi:purine catabolism regulator [Actinocorallia herbida]|uniref:Purine catabolism regulator n=1 Tax=Actinocorallia herbida TaxID=58109 RepID=A0A3N1D536_9ACTN|nr:PucR family transcriptional regulator [Actinocorallia herbida]ROO88610.1 purine catabolism regulator [Actinocorallia herbida]